VLQVLGNYMMFDKATEEAWQWMWDIVIAAFTHHMVSAARLLQTVGSSWEYIETNCDINEISDRFFEHLFRIVPVLQEFFTKPKKMQRVMFIKAMDLIVRSVADTKVLEVDLKAIAMRHIKFDIRSEHLEVFGQVLLQTLGDAVGADRWDEDIESCWADIYGHIAGIFGHVISTGRNLVSKALATNSSDELRRALQITPRKKRILSALEIDVDDSVVSPIVWTITEGQLHLTDVLLKDILTIRGDREHYYYGRSLLWQKHPWICRLLVEKAPKLLPTFLNGHLWVSKYSEEGYRRVNYYVRELYGDPYVPGNWNTYNTPLGLLVSRLPSSEVAVFAHPTIQFVVDLKWEQFARLDFGLQQGLNLLNLALVTTYMQIGDTYPYASFVLSIIQLFTASLRILLFLYKSGSQFSGGHGHNYRVLGLNLLVPYLLHDIFTIISLFASVLVVFLFSQTYTANPFRWQSALDPNEHVTTAAHDYWIANHDPLALRDWATLAAFTTGLLWVQMSEAFKLSNRLSALMFAIMAVLQDVMRFILVLAVWGVGFSIMLYWLFVGHNLREGELIHEALGVDLHLSDRSDVGTVVYWVIMSCLGLTGIDAMMQANILTRVVYAVCVLTTVVVLLNLLVSTMVSTYDILQMSFHELAVQSRANLVIRAEESSSMKRRAKHFNACEFGEKVDFEDGDDGPSGGIQRVVSSRERNHPAYRVLDCIERYAGSSSPDEPFHQDDMISSATTTEDLLGVGLKHTVNHQALLRIQQEVGRLSTELCMMKAATRDDDGTGTSASGSVADPGENSDGGGVEMGENIMSADGKPMGVGSFDTAAHGKFESATGLSEAEEYVKDPLANLRDISMEELHEHGDHLSLWLVVDGVVRDVTTLLGYHPGGKEVLLEAHGKDASDLFHGSHVGPSFTIASAMWKAMPPMGRMSFSEPAVTLPGAVPSLPQATTVTHHQHHDGMPMYTPRDVELDMDV
jgi:hemoglobin-like flavoprotein/cytochrome b involved in lipid metabolism